MTPSGRAGLATRLESRLALRDAAQRRIDGDAAIDALSDAQIEHVIAQLKRASSGAALTEAEEAELEAIAGPFFATVEADDAFA